MERVLFSCCLLLIVSFKSVSCIDCYQCVGTDPTNPFLCNEFLDDDHDLLPISCQEVYGAKHCIKHTGRFEGAVTVYSPLSGCTLPWTPPVSCIKCYQCDSAQHIDCTDMLINEPGNTFQLQDCDNVFEAQFCIKSTALHGGIGTKRYCSALDLGNYCNYVKHAGDQLEYRSCVFTCSTDGCNSATLSTLSASLTLLPLSLLLLYILLR